MVTAAEETTVAKTRNLCKAWRDKERTAGFATILASSATKYNQAEYFSNINVYKNY
ncbi:hypothetical protein RvVAR031_pl03040 (plasmid) [Agrobacterium vitis]|nr:hypothetical protein RvVAR031_pl03040 [Agrobacterium vitis]